ncbi:endonuclease/exonuclease/phosphatase family protein [Streptomyces sp. NPDC047042]|uniref:endonuclease/exonuclease/phosphatase family protein n=1 Tax=Streptomyces sp. NPDC047042 TaxID=3154807 RepID=UPI0033D5C2DA
MRVRAATWSLNRVSGKGAHKQARALADLEPDILTLQRCWRWDEDERSRLLSMAHTVGLTPIHMAPSRVGDVRNFTTMLYRPSKLRLMGWRPLAEGVFHHALIRARLRPLDQAEDEHSEFLAFGTHLSGTDGEIRLKEARWVTEYAGDVPGVPPRALLMGDLNCPSPVFDHADWPKAPDTLRSRYLIRRADGSFGDADTEAMRVLLASGWQDPEVLTGRPRAETVGFYYAAELVPLHLDHVLVHGLPVLNYRTPDTGYLSDHRPAVLDVEVGTSA